MNLPTFDVELEGFHLKTYSVPRHLALVEEIFKRRRYGVGTLGEDPSIIDAGAHEGVATFFFRREYPESRLLSIEADPITFLLLKENVAANRVNNIQLVNAALTDHIGDVPIFRDPEHPGSVHTTMLPGRHPEHVAQFVKGVPLSTLMRNEFEQVSLLKLDIEGSEIAVINDLHSQNCLARVQHIVMEYHHHIVPEWECLSELLSILERNGFGYVILSVEPGATEAGWLIGVLPQCIVIHAYQRIGGHA
jgi:FkbM family methyltransferase